MLSAEAGQVQRARLQPAKLCKAGGHRRELELTLVLPGIGKLPGLAQDRHGGTVVLCVFLRVKAVRGSSLWGVKGCHEAGVVVPSWRSAGRALSWFGLVF